VLLFGHRISGKKERGMPDIDLSKYYTAQEAANRLSLNSNRSISIDYVRQLVAKNKISSVKLTNRFSVYPRDEIDNYVVEERGTKSARAAKIKAKEKRTH
jgi:hypothetical protein